MKERMMTTRTASHVTESVRGDASERHMTYIPLENYRAPSALKGAGHLWLSTVLRHLLNPWNMGFAFAMPLAMYYMFGVNDEYLNYELAHGNITAAILTNMALYGVILVAGSLGATVALERSNGISRMFAMTPMSSTVQILVRIVASMSLSVLIIAVTYLFGYVTGARMDSRTWVLSGVLTALMSVLPGAMGLAAGFAVRGDGAYSLSSLLSVVGAFTSGMFIPLEQMAPVVATIAPWTPFYGMTRVTQALVRGEGLLSWQHVANIVAWTLIFTAAAVWGNKRDTSR